MNDTKEIPWDSMFVKSEERAAAVTPADPPNKIDAGLDKYAAVLRNEADFNRILNFQENLEYIHDWDQREMLGLIIEGVDLHNVNMLYLDHWRKNYQVPPDNDVETL